MKARKGIYAAAITPFETDGRVDRARLIAYCQHLLGPGGCDGIAPTGTTGEGTSIAMADRLALPSVFADAGIGADRVIFGTGAPAAGDALALTCATLEAGFCNVLVLPPYYYKAPSDDGVYAYYARLIDGVGRDDLRVYLYHFPQMSAMPLSVALVQRLIADFGPIVAGLKDSSGDFAQSAAFLDATGGVDASFDIYPSSEAMLWDGLARGSAGIISGSTNAFGALAQAALQADLGPARDAAMDRVRAARAMAGKYPLMAAMKQAEAWRSNDDEWTRMAPPLVALNAVQKQALRKDLKTHLRQEEAA
jgi:4-hydroxy-tetrahydrodipicolinate synthase